MFDSSKRATNVHSPGSIDHVLCLKVPSRTLYLVVLPVDSGFTSFSLQSRSVVLFHGVPPFLPTLIPVATRCKEST